MAPPGTGRPARNNDPYPGLPQGHWSKASRVMTDQQNFEAARPVSADPAVALAQALGQLPKKPVAKPQLAASVETLAKGLGLTIGDQNELTIRRIKRGKSYSFIRANGKAIRDSGTIKRLNAMAVPPAYEEVR